MHFCKPLILNNFIDIGDTRYKLITLSFLSYSNRHIKESFKREDIGRYIVIFNSWLSAYILSWCRLCSISINKVGLRSPCGYMPVCSRKYLNIPFFVLFYFSIWDESHYYMFQNRILWWKNKFNYYKKCLWYK